MKQSGEKRRSVFAAALLVLTVARGQAAAGTWDSDVGTAGAQDGSGNWSTADANWWDGAGNAVWADGADAVFGSASGAAGVVTLSGGSVRPSSVTFNAAGSGAYTIVSEGPYLIDLNGGTRVFTVNASAATLACGATNGSLTKLGSGDLALAGPTTLAGLQINGGSVTVSTNLTIAGTGAGCVFYLGSANPAYAGLLAINTGATVSVTGAFGDAAVVGRDGGDGAVVQSGGLFRFGMTGGSFNVGASSSASTASRYEMNGGVFDLASHNLNVAFFGIGAFTGAVYQAGGVISNVNQLTLGNASAFGSYTLAGGSLYLGAGGIVGTSGRCAVNLGGGTVAASASWTSPLNMNLTNLNGSVTFDTAGNAVTLSGVLSGNGGLIKRGAGGTLALTNANSYAGGTAVAVGILSATHAQALGSGPVTVAGGGTNKLFLSGGITVTNPISLGSEAPGYSDNLRSVSGANIIGSPLAVYQSNVRSESGSTLRIINGIAGTSYVSFNSAGTIQIEEKPIALTNQTVYFGGGNTGTIRLNVASNVFNSANLWGGVSVLLGADDALPTWVNLTANNAAGGKLDLNGFKQMIGTLSQNASYPLTVTNSGAPATFTVNQSANTVFAGLIGGSLTLVKRGGGSLTLTNANTFTGGAVVSNGTLRLGVANALPTAGAVDVAGGLYDLGGYTVTNGAVTVRGGGVVNGTLAAGVVELVGTGSVRVALGGSGGLLKSGAGTADVVSPLSYAGATAVSAGTLRLEPLPQGAVAFYGFDSASELELDLSARGNTLKTLTGTPQYSAAGRFGGALYLNGSSTLGTLSGAFPSGVPTGAAPYTVSAFVKADAGCPVQGGWLGYGNGANSQANNFRLGGTYTNVWNYWWANDFGAAMPSGSFTDGWHCVAGTWDGTTERLYIDGVERASRAASGLNVGTGNFVIGRTIGDANFKGWVDEVLIASRAFSAAEVAALFSSSAVTARSLPPGTALSVAAGAAVDLNRASQTVAALSGEGTVTGGALTVTGRISAGSAPGAAGALAVQSGLTLAAGVTNAVDCSAEACDVVNVRGALTLQGAGTVAVSLADPLLPPRTSVLFTFDTLSGAANLAAWTVTGVPTGYRASLKADANSIRLTLGRVGAMILLR